MNRDLFGGHVETPDQNTSREGGGWCRAGESGRPIVLSFGGGTQTSAICVAILQGLLPRPETIVMADTGREGSETWEYLRDVVGPALLAEGMRVEIAAHELATVDLFSKKGKVLMPMFTDQSGAGELGQLTGFCSTEWKQRVVRRYLRSEGYGPARPVEMWMGMSTDELGRMKTADVQWITTAWPLAMRLGWDRVRCASEVLSFGWPQAPKSSCWCCPYRTNAHHRETKEQRPDDWQLAVLTEREVRRVDPNAYVHRSGVPLDQVDLDAPEGQELGCDSGFCWV